MTASVHTRRAGTIRLSAVLGVSVGVALLAACSSAASSSSTPAASSTSSTPAAAASGSTTALVITTKSSSAGDFLTNGSGQAIYMWTKDSMNASACSGACASAWPPVTATGALTAAGGVNKADLSTFARSDGTKQVAYDGHPLYYFVGDSKPGEISGQGSDGFGAKWWLVNTAGTAITTSVTVSSGATSSAPASPASGGGGY
jgi:predicted lipoprotein with Yx(FWY)xxD motif